jgi:hypothetical protein
MFFQFFLAKKKDDQRTPNFFALDISFCFESISNDYSKKRKMSPFGLKRIVHVNADDFEMARTCDLHIFLISEYQ